MEAPEDERIAKVTQTCSHCGYRDENSRLEFVLNAGACEVGRSNSETYHGSERKTGQGRLREECLESLPGRMLLLGDSHAL